MIRRSLDLAVAATILLLSCVVSVSVSAVDILFIGDSDVEGWSTNGKYADSINKGVGGHTCLNVLNRIDRILTQTNPNKVVIVCGENDLADESSVRQTFNRFKSVIAKINASGAQAIYMGTKPEPGTKELHPKYRRYDGMITNHGSSIGFLSSFSSSNIPALMMIDVYNGFEDLGNPRNFYQSDELHLSKRGYSKWDLWLKKALGDDTGCIRWRSNECMQTLPISEPTTMAPISLTPNMAPVAPITMAPIIAVPTNDDDITSGSPVTLSDDDDSTTADDDDNNPSDDDDENADDDNGMDDDDSASVDDDSSMEDDDGEDNDEDDSASEEDDDDGEGNDDDDSASDDDDDDDAANTATKSTTWWRWRL